MKLKDLLDKLDTNVTICIKTKDPERFLNHEYNICEDECVFSREIYSSIQAYHTSILDVLNEYGQSEVKHIYKIFSPEIMLCIVIGEFPDLDYDIV